MGDVADAMLDGDLCQGCGVYMPNGQGFPQTCSACERESHKASGPQAPIHADCPYCGKRVKAAGLQMHVDAKHKVPQADGGTDA